MGTGRQQYTFPHAFADSFKQNGHEHDQINLCARQIRKVNHLQRADMAQELINFGVGNVRLVVRSLGASLGDAQLYNLEDAGEVIKWKRVPRSATLALEVAFQAPLHRRETDPNSATPEAATEEHPSDLGQ